MFGLERKDSDREGEALTERSDPELLASKAFLREEKESDRCALSDSRSCQAEGCRTTGCGFKSGAAKDEDAMISISIGTVGLLFPEIGVFAL
jgi:hypothetical protein